ncbi:MAG: glycosyltransferase, partial [Desulfonatronospira sp. MSAO_Bac3]
PGVNVAVLATGEPEYESFLQSLSDRPNLYAVIAFDAQKAGQISLGSDVFLMPSLFEPCGITQMQSMSHATPPLVRWTGGLADTVRPHNDPAGTGFGFDGSSRREILTNQLEAVNQARQVYTQNPLHFRALQYTGYYERFLWANSALEYIEKLYQPVMKM